MIRPLVPAFLLPLLFAQGAEPGEGAPQEPSVEHLRPEPEPRTPQW